MKNLLNSAKAMMVIGFVGLYLISTGVSWALFTYIGGDGPGPIDLGELANARSKINMNLPRTEECPINGGMFTKIEKNIWDKRRPVAAIIENHLDSRPQSGLSRADVVYEAVAEGGITRFLGIFYCGGSASEVSLAPIRSARIYFVNWAAGYGRDPIFLHQGGANNFCNDCPGGVKPRGTVAKEVDAYAALDKLGWRNGRYGNDLDGGFNVDYPVVKRDQYRLSLTPAAWEHSVVASLDKVYDEAKKRGFEDKDDKGVSWDDGFRKWKFADDKAVSAPAASTISFTFWDNKPDYDVEWKYDSVSNSYKRFNGGKSHTDWEFDKPQLTTKNLVIMYVKEKGPVDREFHMFYETLGEGKALYFRNGTVEEGTWEKATALDREVFYDNNGKEIAFVRGAIWIEAVPSGNTVNY